VVLRRRLRFAGSQRRRASAFRSRKDGPGIGDPDYNKYSQRIDATSTIPPVIAVTKKPVWTLSMSVLPFG
jgi:hypothetical protein